MARQPLPNKPGAERNLYTPDAIAELPVKAPTTLLEHLSASMPQCKRTTVKNYLKHNQVMVNGEVTRQFDRNLMPGDEVKVNTSREFQVFGHSRVKIYYEDDDIIVAYKGYGLLSVATERDMNKKKEATAYSILRDYLKRKDPRNKLYIVHRLDKATSGLMMFAKTQEAKEAMQHNWNNMVLERKYVAVVEGYMEENEGMVRSYLVENARHEVYSTDDPSKGKLAVTYYKTLARRNGYSLVELSLETGRKNQIRVHMKDLGHPIAGDKRYGARTSPIHRVALHAQTLRFAHPITRKDMNFTSAIPAAFEKLV
ncbi:MAG: RluA family pseudouridine synthase [Muribaculaceae bacterium]|nr:RluA family pseudouridine synthase [Muribaculaceae bacterium]